MKLVKDKKEKANALHNIGVAYKNLSNYDNALQYHLNALKIREAAGDKKAIADSLHYIGVVYDYSNNFDKALEYHFSALKIRKEIGYRKGIANSLHNIGVINHRLNHYTKALKYYLNALKIREEIGDKKAIAGSLNNIGVIYKNIINYVRSLEYYLKALKMFEELDDKYETANISNNIGELYLKLKDYDKAFSYLEKALKIAREIGAKELIRENYEFHSDLWAAKGNYQKALEYYMLSSKVKDTIFTEESSAKIAEMQTIYETEKKEKEIELLKKDNAISQLELARQKLLRNSFLGGFGFVLILAFVVYNRYRLKKKAHAELEAAHHIIKLEKEKSDKLLLNILPLRVANDLKEKGKTEPESYENVTVYFSDIVGFTKKSAELDPKFLIDELNDIFTAFDNIIEKNHCERIKTIGDAYLCVCGMPEENSNHAKNVVRSAIEIIEYLKKRNHHTKAQWEIRVGIHTGKVVGGVVGVKKYIYDVFGDTINTASRMESNSEPMKINISEATYHLVKHKFKFVERETIVVKGKGDMKMYFIDNG
ncbi:adenylate/guanylate cyclase domain-containing protein [Desulfonema magnum]|uniref:adenylate/guanylate cyclase domain-containing protein n=1 Tax=Desulfonema magnum TaxID=45655 RepID=UPI001A9C2373|nr:adenylate/guanylate cyclase domain-containing protein [Desulfonema magnum]